MENFLDIFTTLVKVMWRWHKRGVVNKFKLIARFLTLLEIATWGRDGEKDWFNGYLYTAYDNIGRRRLKEVCEENNYCAEVVAVLLMVQVVRFKKGEPIGRGKVAERPNQILAEQSNMVRESIDECSLEYPTAEEVQKAFESYRMLTANEVQNHLAEL